MNAPSTSQQAPGWRFIGLASLGRNTPGSYAWTLTGVVLTPVVFLALAFTGLYAGAAAHRLPQAAVPPLLLAAALIAVILAGVALAWGVVRSHRRPWMSLVSPDLRFDARRFAIGATVQGLLIAASLVVAHIVGGQPWPEGSGMSWPMLAGLLLLVPFQAASEEMLFRGYLTQAFGRVTRSRLLIALVVGIAFGALHMNAYGPMTLPYLGGLSVLFSVVSLRDERLELVIGAHAATNWFGIGAVNAMAEAGSKTRLGWPALIGLLINGALFFAITRRLVRLLCEPADRVRMSPADPGGSTPCDRR